MHVIFKKKAKHRNNFRKVLEKESVRKTGGVHEDEIETLGVVRGIFPSDGGGELVHVVACLDVTDTPGC